MMVLIILRILLVQFVVRSVAKPESWIEAGSGERKMCGGATAECTSAQTCTYHAYGPCGGATEPSVYFEANIEGMGIVYDSEAYLTDSTKAEVIKPAEIENNKYISKSASEKAGDAEYAYISAGAWYGDPAVSGGFLGMASYLLKKGTITTKSNTVIVPTEPGKPEMESFEVCISDLDGEECGAERTFNAGEYKFSLYGYSVGSDYTFPPTATHFGIRTKLALVGAKAQLRIKSPSEDRMLTLDELGSADVTQIVVTEEAEDGRAVTIDFPPKYNFGTTPEGLMKPSVTKDVKIKVSKGPDGEQSIYIDYLFEPPDKALQYFIYDPTVTDTPRGSLVEDVSHSAICVSPFILAVAVHLMQL
jgi:hypothetical protein